MVFRRGSQGGGQGDGQVRRCSPRGGAWRGRCLPHSCLSACFRYDALFEEDSDAKRPLTETLEPGRLRPLPPKAQEGWLRKAKAGLPLELKHDGGWWQAGGARLASARSQPLSRGCPALSVPTRGPQVEFVSVADGGDAETATQLLVRGAGELWGGAEILADVSSLRPGWHFNAASQSWGSRGAAAAAAPKKSRSGSKSRRSGARPDKGAA